jgi:uncharacterized protein YegL
VTDDMFLSRQKCLPTYLVIDVSGSMIPHQRALNDTLGRLHTALVNSPRVSEFANISLVAFASQPWVVLEMTDMEYVPGMPQITCGGGTDYAAAFDLVRQRIEVDVPNLTAQNKAVLRPCVFFLTDGAPFDNGWQAAFQRLTDKAWKRHPHVITYGFGDASELVLSKVATRAAFVAEGGADQDEALARAINGLLNSLVASARTEEMQIPVETTGYRSIPVEYMD